MLCCKRLISRRTCRRANRQSSNANQQVLDPVGLKLEELVTAEPVILSQPSFSLPTHGISPIVSSTLIVRASNSCDLRFPGSDIGCRGIKSQNGTIDRPVTLRT